LQSVLLLSHVMVPFFLFLVLLATLRTTMEMHTQRHVTFRRCEQISQMYRPSPIRQNK